MKISIIIPCYNEDGNIALISHSILSVLNNHDLEIIFVDDGSNDNSLNIIKSLCKLNSNIHFISFSRNFGHQNAIKAGIDYSTGDCVISMDADMQHPVNLLPQMIEKWATGYHIVYTQRQDDKRLSFAKRLTSRTFYKLMNFISDTDIEQGAADFRLIDKQVANILKETDENHLFIRGLISWLGFKKYKLVYKPASRRTGLTKYSFKKMTIFALNGITSFSTKPLSFAILVGMLISALSFLYGFYAILLHLLTDKAIQGWTSVLVSVLLIGGIQLIVLGIIGEYIGKIFIQSKHRPNYIIKESDISNYSLKKNI